MSLTLWNSTQRSIDSFLSQKAAGALGGIKNPLVKSLAGSLVNSFIPGFGGGIPDFRETAYADVVDRKVAASSEQLSNYISTYSDADAKSLKYTYDWRARLRPKNGGADRFYTQMQGTIADYLLRPIKESNGLVWQYTPNTSMGGSAEYNSTQMQGMNYPINTFISSKPNDINLTSDFTANDIYEARYMLAVFMFLRISTKAYFGDAAVADGSFGTPPPVLVFEYLGDHGFNKVPVVVTNYNIQLSDDVDYVPVVAGPGDSGTVTYIPTKANISVSLLPTYTPNKLRKRFDLKSVTSGQAYKDGFI